MLKSSDIRDALGRLIKIDAGLSLKVYFNRVEHSNEDYAWIRLRTSRKDEGFGMFARDIRVDIMVVLCPDKYARKMNTKLLQIADLLDEATCGYIRVDEIDTEENPDNPKEPIKKIADTRYITIYDTSANIFDDILTYSFELNFADYCDKFFKSETAAYDYMEQLCLKLNETEYSSP